MVEQLVPGTLIAVGAGRRFEDTGARINFHSLRRRNWRTNSSKRLFRQDSTHGQPHLATANGFRNCTKGVEIRMLLVPVAVWIGEFEMLLRWRIS